MLTVDSSYSRLSANISVELYVDGHIMSREFPRVEVQPVIRDLNLVSINELLLKNTISVAKSISPCWHVHSGHTVQKAGCKTTKATVTKRCIVLLRYDIFNPEAQFF